MCVLTLVILSLTLMFLFRLYFILPQDSEPAVKFLKKQKQLTLTLRVVANRSADDVLDKNAEQQLAVSTSKDAAQTQRTQMAGQAYAPSGKSWKEELALSNMLMFETVKI